MTPEQITLVRRTWNSAVERSLPVAELFYQRLFSLDPALRKLFLNDLDAQRNKFLKTFGLIVKQLDKPASLNATVYALGVKHAGYGVKDDHYDTVERALLWALRETFGDAFDEPTSRAWRQAYRALADGMIAADLDRHRHAR